MKICIRAPTHGMWWHEVNPSFQVPPSFHEDAKGDRYQSDEWTNERLDFIFRFDPFSASISLTINWTLSSYDLYANLETSFWFWLRTIRIDEKPMGRWELEIVNSVLLQRLVKEVSWQFERDGDKNKNVLRFHSILDSTQFSIRNDRRWRIRRPQRPLLQQRKKPSQPLRSNRRRKSPHWQKLRRKWRKRPKHHPKLVRRRNKRWLNITSIALIQWKMESSTSTDS